MMTPGRSKCSDGHPHRLSALGLYVPVLLLLLGESSLHFSYVFRLITVEMIRLHVITIIIPEGLCFPLLLS